MKLEHPNQNNFNHGGIFFDPVLNKELYFPNLRVILPTAPKRAVTLNNGYMMNSWFDIFSSDENIT